MPRLAHPPPGIAIGPSRGVGRYRGEVRPYLRTLLLCLRQCLPVRGTAGVLIQRIQIHGATSP